MEDYPKIKFIESIVFSHDIESKLQAIVLDIRFLICLEKYLDTNQTENYIDSTIKEKIYKIVKYIRFDLKSRKMTEQENELLNLIIKKTNRVKEGNILGFYYNQANVRAHDAKTISADTKMTMLLDMLELIKESISYDYEILSDLNKSPEEKTRIVEKYKGNGWFLCSVKGMYAECSEIFDKKEIKENLKSVIDANEKILIKKNLRYSNSEIRRQILER